MKCPLPLGRFGRFASLILLGYTLLVAGAYLFQRSLMYHPSIAPFDPAANGLVDVRKIETPALGSNEKLAHWTASEATKGKPTIVFFQGNAGGLDRRAHKFRDWQKRGYGLLLIGYPGFGNPAEPSEDSLYDASRAAIAAWTSQTGQRPEQTLVYYGESLGTGVATQMALEIKPLALILEAPYTSFGEVGAFHYPYLPVTWLIKDHYSTISKIASVQTPLLVLHGLADETVPFTQGQIVFEAAQEPKTSFYPAMAMHNDLFDHGAGDEIESFLSTLP